LSIYNFLGGDAVEKYLNIIGWSKAEFAKAVGIPPTIVTQWTAGHREIPPEILDYLANLVKAYRSVKAPRIKDYGELTEAGRQHRSEINQRFREKNSKG